MYIGLICTLGSPRPHNYPEPSAQNPKPQGVTGLGFRGFLKMGPPKLMALNIVLSSTYLGLGFRVSWVCRVRFKV